MKDTAQASGGGVARWPYMVALVSAMVAALGLVYAPISGIVYVLGLPGLLVTAVWALVHRVVPARPAVPLAAAFMLAGLVMGAAVLAVGDRADSIALMSNVWYDAGVIGALLLLPLTSIVLAVVGASYGLGSQALRRRGMHVVDLQS